ncbi:MAG: aspartyl-tRNA(Asn)/glutamyl-tRNA(Gln) amidotransferase subunit, partial [Kribbellaceae bacterium]|nr:aspartyl-tRNA(Asn)/glutamyl-tRNA(Gln) amidotransferase subunit [Kribbellaceae bacterium]
AHPAATVNCGYSTTGLPIGLQIAAPRFADLPALRLAAALTTLLPVPREWPTSPA